MLMLNRKHCLDSAARCRLFVIGWAYQFLQQYLFVYSHLGFGHCRNGRIKVNPIMAHFGWQSVMFVKKGKNLRRNIFSNGCQKFHKNRQSYRTSTAKKNVTSLPHPLLKNPPAAA